jgi:hypothetical protein
MQRMSGTSSCSSSAISNVIVDDAVLELRRMTEMLTARSAAAVSPLNMSASTASLLVRQEQKRVSELSIQSTEQQAAVRPLPAMSRDELNTEQLLSATKQACEQERQHDRTLAYVIGQQRQQSQPLCLEPKRRIIKRENLSASSLPRQQPALRSVPPPLEVASKRGTSSAPARAVAANVRVAVAAHRDAVAALRRQELAIMNLQGLAAAVWGGPSENPQSRQRGRHRSQDENSSKFY